jgi:TP901 family phage tail tape measure protein
MAKKITKSDISDADVFGSLRESAEKALQQIQELDGVLRQMASDTAEKLKNVKFDSAKSINEFTKAAKEANNVQKESVKIDQEEAKLKQQIVKIDQEIEKAKQQEQKTMQQELRTQSQINREKERQAKIAAKNKKAVDDEANAYKKLVKETRNLKNESKTLAAEMINLERSGKRNTKEYAALENQYKSVTKAAQKADGQLKKIDSTVGDNFRNVGNYGQAIGKLKGMLGQLGLAFGGLQILKSSGETIANFEQTMANLSSITGATGDDLQALEDAAISLGGKTTLSASQVAEGFKLIGSAKPELLQNKEALIGVTENAIKLAEAAGITLPEAASALTNTLNQFGADADQAAKFVDVLAAGSKFGAGDINFLNAAMEKAGTVAKVAGLDFRETGAALEVLAKSGVPAEKAGTDFRNILLKLQAAGIGFVDGQFEIKEALEETKDMLGAMEDPAERAAAASKLFGSQSVASAEFMMQNIDLYDELNQAMDENGIASEQQKINTETLQGAIAMLKSKWEELLLTLNKNVGIANILRSVVLFLANNLKNIMRVVGVLVKGFIAYKTIQMAVIARQKLLNLQVALSQKGFMGLVKSLAKSAAGMLGFGKGMKGASKGAKGLGMSLKAIPFVAIIGVVLELASAMWDLFSNTEAAAEAQAKLEAMNASRVANDERNEAALAKNREGRAALLEQSFKDIEQARRQAVIDGKSQAEADQEAMDAKEAAIRANIAAIKEEHKAVKQQYQDAKKTNDLFKSDAFGPAHLAVKFWGTAKSMRESQKVIMDGQNAMNQEFSNAGDAITRTEKVMDDASKATAGMNEEIKNYQDQLTDISLDEQEQKKSRSASHSSRIREIRTEFSTSIDLQKELNVETENYVNLQKDLDDIGRKAALDSINKQMKAELDFIKASSELGRKITTQKYVELAAEKLRIQKEQLEADRKEDIESEKIKFDKRFQLIQKRLDDEKARLIANAQGNQSKIDEINANAQIEQEKLDEWKVAAEGNLQQKITNINAAASNKRSQMEIASAKDTAEKLLKIREKAIDDRFDRELKLEEFALLKSGKKKEDIQKALDAKEIELLKKRSLKKRHWGLIHWQKKSH